MKLYTALCVAVMAVLSFLVITRKDVDATVFRTPGLLFQERGADSISNLYNIQFANKTLKDIPLTIKLSNSGGTVQLIGKQTIHIEKEGEGSGSFFIILPKKIIQSRKTDVKLDLYEGNNKLNTISTSFLGPVE